MRRYALVALFIFAIVMLIILGGLSTYATWLAYGWAYFVALLLCTAVFYVTAYLLYKGTMRTESSGIVETTYTTQELHDEYEAGKSAYYSGDPLDSMRSATWQLGWLDAYDNAVTRTAVAK